MTTRKLDLAGLTTRIVEPSSRPTSPDVASTVVLLHGFGAPGEDLVSLAEVIDAPVRWVFPEAPLELGGMYGDARAWWLLDLARLEDELRRGAPRDRRDEVPDGLVAARDHVTRLIDQLVARYPTPRLVLGGFSQGAMLALDVALHREIAPSGLILMSGTLLAASVWEPRLPKLAGVPMLMSHGRSDTLLPFGIAEVLRDKLRAAGAVVDWHEFAGGHEIPMAVLAAATKFLARN
ncbi:MAG: alpha/beta fold hydrolase [Deltaproteobacteria bacterium]|nr:alpha/beta fold hydrolase [Deltaproteobacteria bacterium]MDQ3296182.1 alpha/beta fold hydrolase [Myxococcota bacterium]